MSSPEQALQSFCELLRETMIFKVKEMHTSSCKCIPAYGPAFKLMELMKAYVSEYKLMELHGSFCNCMLVFGSDRTPRRGDLVRACMCDIIQKNTENEF